ncbi:hypothetical protein ACOY70_09370, partial [Enterobacter asburiae]
MLNKNKFIFLSLVFFIVGGCSHATSNAISPPADTKWVTIEVSGNDSNLLIVFYVQIMPDDFVMQLHR